MSQLVQDTRQADLGCSIVEGTMGFIVPTQRELRGTTVLPKLQEQIERLD